MLRFVYIDPLYPITFLSNNSFPLIGESIFQASFLCILLLFWLCVYHGIRQVGNFDLIYRF